MQDNKKNAPPSKERIQANRRLSDTIKEEATNRRIYQAKKAGDKVDREERNTNTFNANYKQTQTRKPISKLYRMEGTAKAPPDETTGETPTADDVSEMTQVSAGYYKALMSEKTTSKHARDTLTAKIAEKPFSANAAAKLEGVITEKEVRQQIRKLARGKACGPDGIAAEFYRIHENLIAGFLTATLNEMHEEGELTPSMKQGNIILLHKKKYPYDIRSYRPITLLNTDYKILTKILVSRFKRVINQLIDKTQTGFVPKRHITENTLLCRLIQSYLDETDEAGLMLFLDLEKAFDRVSHEYLYEAVKAAGVGTDMLRWIEILYNPASPMQRTTQINGHKSIYFPIRSGVAQGCPLSAILFLFVTEGFSRYLQDAEVSFEGITID
eukprot:6748874-Prymnesium_polylepis.1